MLQVNPVNRPDIKEVLTGLEAIAIAMDVDLKGKVVSYKFNPVLVYTLITQGTLLYNRVHIISNFVIQTFHNMDTQV